MGAYDYLIPGNAAKSPAATGGQYDYLIPKSTPAAVPPPNLLKDTITGLPAAARSVGKAIAEPFVAGFQNTPVTPKTASPVMSTVHAFSDAIKQGAANLNTQVGTIVDNHSTALQKGVAVGETVVGTINSVFGALLSPLQGLATVPGVGSVVDGVNKVFGAIGEGAGGNAVNILNTLPLSQATKDTLLPLVHDTASLVAQFAIGKLGHDVVTKIADNAKAITTTISDDAAVKIPVQSDTTATDHPAEPVETVKPTEEPAQDGSKPAPIAPEVPETPPTPSFKPLQAPETAPEAPGAPKTPVSPEDPAAPKQPLQAPKQADTAKPLQTAPGQSKIGKSIEVKAVDAKLTEGFKGTAGYDPITIKDQAERATKLVSDNIDQARAVVRGDAPLPEGLKGTALIIAMEEHIKANPDGELAHELANSPLVSATSGAAQELRLAAERIPDSITAKFREVKAAREAAVEKRGGMKKQVEAAKSDIKKEIKRTVSKPQTWDDFIRQVQCQY